MAGQKVKVSELVVDFKKGMSTSELIQKYGVTEPQLKALTKKLVELGHLTQADIDRRAGAQAVVAPPPPAAAEPPAPPKAPEPPQPPPAAEPPEAPVPPAIPKTPETPPPPPAATPPETPIPPEPAKPSGPLPQPPATKPPAASREPEPPQPPPAKASVDAEDAIDMLGEDDRGWECPACGQRQGKKQAECPSCGVIVEKFLKRQKEIEEQKKSLEEAERAAAQEPSEEKTEQESIPEGPSASVPASEIPPEVSEATPVPREAPAVVPESEPAPETEPKPEEDIPVGTKPARVPIRLPGFLSKSPLLTGGVALGVVLIAVAAVLLSSRTPGMPKKSREWVINKLTDLPMGYVGKTYAGKDRRTPIGLYLKVKDVKILDVAESSLIPAGEVLKSYCMKLEVSSDVHTGPVLPQEYLQRYRKYTSTDGWDYHQGWEKITAKTTRYKEFTTIFNTMVDLTRPKESGRKFDTHFSQTPQPKVIYTGDNCPNEWDKFCPFGCKAE